MRLNKTLLAARVFYLALIAVAPALLAAATGRRYIETCTTAGLALLALGAVAVWASSRPSLQSLRAQLLFPLLLALSTLGLSARVARAEALDLAVLGGSGLACALAAAGARRLLGERGVLRFTGRVVAVTALGALGLVALLPLGLGNDPHAVLAAALGVACIASLILAAAGFEGAHGQSTKLRTFAADLLLGSWLEMSALMSASVVSALLTWRVRLDADSFWSVWVAARASAGASWSSTLPLVAALLALFAGRLRLLGAGVLSTRGDFAWAPLALVLPSALTLGLIQMYRGSVSSAETTAVAAAAPSARHEPSALPEAPASAAEPEPEPAEVEVEGEAAEVEPEPAPAAVASAAPSASVVVAPAGDGVTVEVSATDGDWGADARLSIVNRLPRLEECTQRAPAPAGTLHVRLVVSLGGSVTNVVPLAGDLLGSKFAKCVMVWLYRIGFAPHSREISKFEVTLRFAGGAL
jgi:hypothetical protein